MSRNKKKHRPAVSPVKIIPTGKRIPLTEANPISESTVSATEEIEVVQVTAKSEPPRDNGSDPLVHEVQSFLRQRQELAQRLAEEIAATEEKLAELKNTAAMLFPESQGSSAKDRKVKKVKKVVTREKIESPELPSDGPAAE